MYAELGPNESAKCLEWGVGSGRAMNVSTKASRLGQMGACDVMVPIENRTLVVIDYSYK